MEALELILLVLSAVLLSSIIDQVVPKLTAPLIQIGLGLLIGLLATERITISLNPTMFMVALVAPLVYYDARELNKADFWRYRGQMLSYAVLLVIFTTIVVGFAINALIPSISLAVAFALAAALSPTDVVSVSSLAREANIPHRQKAVLMGESLINDASGIVCFQFAIAAAITGSFSALDAVGDFLIQFVGGIVVGMAAGWLFSFSARKVRDLGLESTTFHVLLEVLAPFIVFLFADAIGVSGIITVIGAGIVMSMAPKSLGPAPSRLNIVSNSVWQVLAFALNGFVFVLLGTQLPNALGNSWSETGLSLGVLTFYIVGIALAIYAVRMAWVIVTERILDRRAQTWRPWGEVLRSCMVTTLSGAKGAITLAVMLTVPTWVSVGAGMERFPNRGMLIFLCCAVIVLSLLVATYVAPLFAESNEDDDSVRAKDLDCKLGILRSVIEELTAHQTPETRIATQEAVRQYNERIARMKAEGTGRKQVDTELRIQVLRWEQEFVLEQIDEGAVPPLEGYRYLNRLAHTESLIRKDKLRIFSLKRRVRGLLGTVRNLWRSFRFKMPGPNPSEHQVMRDIQLRCTHYAIERMRSEMKQSPIPSEAFGRLILEYQRIYNTVHAQRPSISAYTQRTESVSAILHRGLQFELECIQEAYENGFLSRAGAQAMRSNVHLMQLDLADYV